jgi:hypothetical protein
MTFMSNAELYYISESPSGRSDSSISCALAIARRLFWPKQGDSLSLYLEMLSPWFGLKAARSRLRSGLGSVARRPKVCDTARLAQTIAAPVLDVLNRRV